MSPGARTNFQKDILKSSVRAVLHRQSFDMTVSLPFHPQSSTSYAMSAIGNLLGTVGCVVVCTAIDFAALLSLRIPSMRHNWLVELSHGKCRVLRDHTVA